MVGFWSFYRSNKRCKICTLIGWTGLSDFTCIQVIQAPKIGAVSYCVGTECSHPFPFRVVPFLTFIVQRNRIIESENSHLPLKHQGGYGWVGSNDQCLNEIAGMLLGSLWCEYDSLNNGEWKKMVKHLRNFCEHCYSEICLLENWTPSFKKL